MKQVLIITDSIGAPRAEPLFTPYKMTWVSLLEDWLLERGYKTFAFTERAMDTEMLMGRIKTQLQFYQPDLVFLQIGICDCAPRALKPNELRLLRLLPGIRTLVHRWLKKNYAWISARRNLTYVDPVTFESNLKQFKEKFVDAKIVAVPIAPSTPDYVKKSPKIDERIRHYNSILKRVFNDGKNSYLELFTEAGEKNLSALFTVDQHHLTERGHQILFESAMKQLQKSEMKL